LLSAEGQAIPTAEAKYVGANAIPAGTAAVH